MHLQMLLVQDETAMIPSQFGIHKVHLLQSLISEFTITEFTFFEKVML